MCEVSSFQLEDTLAFAPEAAVLLNLTPGPPRPARHVRGVSERRSSRSSRARATTTSRSRRCGLGVEDLGGCARRVCFGEGAGAALSLSAGELWWEERPLLRVDELRLRGATTCENAMAAAAVCLARGVERDAVRAGLRSFAGVAHRLEEVGAQGRRAVRERLEGHERREHARRAGGLRGQCAIHLILGGQGKGQDFAALREPVARELPGGVSDRRGRTSDRRARWQGGRSPVHECGDLEQAVSEARRGGGAGGGGAALAGLREL